MLLDGWEGSSGSSAALARGFKEDDGSGSGYIERRDATGHRDAKQVVAGAADEIVEASALAAEDDDEVAGEVELIVVGRAAFVETDDPEIVALEIFEGTDEIDDPRDAEVFGCASAGFESGGAEGRGAALGEEDAVDSGAVGDAKESAEILRIFNAIEGEDEPCGGGVGGSFEEVFKDEEFLRADEGDDALMGGRFGRGSELFARILLYAYAGLAALGDEMLEAIVLALACDEDVIKAAAAGLERFFDRMQAVEDFHNA